MPRRRMLRMVGKRGSSQTETCEFAFGEEGADEVHAGEVPDFDGAEV
jgi:hypothetical protein